MIPKIINYCWFGGKPLPELAVKCISSWKKHCPEYKIIEWNESNFDINCSNYTKEAYKLKKWAFVSDYARLWIVYNYGGIYLDTDVELIDSLDDLLENKFYLGTEKSGFVNTGIGFGSEKANHIIKSLLNEYDGKHFSMSNGVFDTTPCPKRNTEPLLKQGFIYDEKRIFDLDGGKIYPPDYFCPLNYETGDLTITNNTHSIHHFSALWVDAEASKEAEMISCILNRKGPRFIKEFRKQYYLYTIQKEKGCSDSFILYLINKIRIKL